MRPYCAPTEEARWQQLGVAELVRREVCPPWYLASTEAATNIEQINRKKKVVWRLKINSFFPKTPFLRSKYLPHIDP